jgi:hypothetical protein
MAIVTQLLNKQDDTQTQTASFKAFDGLQDNIEGKKE